MSTTDTIAPAQVIVTLEDGNMVNKFKNAIKLFKGIKSVTVRKPKKTGLELALEDVRKGRVYKAKDAHELIEQCLK